MSGRVASPPALRAPAARLRRPSYWTLVRREHRLYALPAVLLVAAMFVVPLLLNFYFSFTNWTSYSSVAKPNGFANFAFLISQGYLQKGITVTLLYAVIAMAGQNVAALLLALALKDTNRLNGFFRALFFVPVLISSIAGGYIWRAIFAAHGPLNGLIGLVIPGFSFEWLGNDWTALPLVALTDAWKWSGLTTLVYIAGLNAVPKELLEAARIDGATRWQSFWRVTFPLLGPAVTFNIAVTLVSALSAYDLIVSMTGGGPGNDTNSLYYVMRLQFGQGFFGTGSALGTIVTLLVVVIAVPLVTWLRRREVQL
jgi:raffinose/stachyose/melibiose transport system permease protein